MEMPPELSEIPQKNGSHSLLNVPAPLVTVAALVILIWGLGTARTFFIPVCIAALLAVLMDPIVTFLNRRRFPEWLSITLGTILFLAPIASALWFLAYEIQLVIRDLPKIGAALNQFILNLAQKELPKSLNMSGMELLPQITDKILSSAGQGLQLVLFGVKNIFETSIQALLILVLSIVMVASRRELRVSFEEAMAMGPSGLPLKNPIPKLKVIDEIIELIEQFLLTRLIIVAIVGALDFMVLYGFSIEYSFILATFLGIVTLIPAIGFILGLIPTLIIAISFGHSMGTTLGMLGCLTLVSAIESHILTPKLLGTRLNLNLLATLLGVLAFSLLWGVWGLFLGVPILGILRIALFQTPSLKRWGILLADPKALNAPSGKQSKR